MKPKISIIIPVYKTEQYLDRCMKSVLGQTFKELEILLIDDASPGGGICNEYSKRDDRVKVIRFEQNKGISAVRNEGLRLTSAPYISFVDSDDWVHEEMYAELFSLREKYNADIASCGIKWQSKIQPVTPRNRLKKNDFAVVKMTGPEALKNLLTSQLAASHTACVKLYRREIFEDIEYPEGRVYEDAATTYKLYFKAKTVAHTNAPYYNYFINPQGITNSGFKPRAMDKLLAAEEILDFVQQNCPELIPHAKSFQTVAALRLAADLSPPISQKHPNEYAQVHKLLLNSKKNPQLAPRHKTLLFLYKYFRPLFHAAWRRRLERAN